LLFVVACVCSLYRMQLYVFVCFSLVILNAWASNPLVAWHKLTYLVLTCRKTPINQSINQFIGPKKSYNMWKLYQHIILLMNAGLRCSLQKVFKCTKINQNQRFKFVNLKSLSGVDESPGPYWGRGLDRLFLRLHSAQHFVPPRLCGSRFFASLNLSSWLRPWFSHPTVTI